MPIILERVKQSLADLNNISKKDEKKFLGESFLLSCVFTTYR